MSVGLSGSAFQWPAGEPATLSSLLLSRIDRNPDSRFIEIDQAGERASRTTAELYLRALEILPQLRSVRWRVNPTSCFALKACSTLFPPLGRAFAADIRGFPGTCRSFRATRISAQGCRFSAGSSIILSCSPPTASWEGLLPSRRGRGPLFLSIGTWTTIRCSVPRPRGAD